MFDLKLDSIAIMIREGSKVALGLIDAPSPAMPKPPKLTVIQGGRANDSPRRRRSPTVLRPL